MVLWKVVSKTSNIIRRTTLLLWEDIYLQCTTVVGPRSIWHSRISFYRLYYPCSNCDKRKTNNVSVLSRMLRNLYSSVAKYEPPNTQHCSSIIHAQCSHPNTSLCIAVLSPILYFWNLLVHDRRKFELNEFVIVLFKSWIR